MQRSKRFRDRLGANGPGLTVAVIALVFALVGGAFAAGGGLTGQQKKEVIKIAKKYAGKPGPAGAQGSPGAKGDKGDKGDTGSQGPEGKQGEKGKDGKDGTSVVSSLEPTGTGNCEGRGGSKFVAGASTTFACNGKEGSPWTAGGTLPAEKTETGAWAVSGSKAEAEALSGLYESISFPIPLALSIPEDHVVYVEGFGPSVPNECKPDTGFISASKPYADPGYLCVFVSSEGTAPLEFTRIELISGTKSEESGADTAGARLRFQFLENVPYGFASGTFAVTAPAP